MSGFAYAPKPSEPNKLVVRLPIAVGGVTLLQNEGNYQVIDTDYTNYAIVYSCTQFLFTKNEIVWILGRQKTMDATTLKNAQDKVKNLGISTSSLINVNQSC